MKTSSVHIPLVDLTAQYKSIRKGIDKAIQGVIKRGIYIGGDEVKKRHIRTAIALLQLILFSLQQAIRMQFNKVAYFL